MHGRFRFGDRCLFEHKGKGDGLKQTIARQAVKEQPMSIAQHAAIVKYTEANGKDASEVKWDTVQKMADWQNGEFRSRSQAQIQRHFQYCSSARRSLVVWWEA